MNASEIMSKPVVITKGNVKLNHLKDLLSRNKISATPVLTEEGAIEGIVTASDLKANHNEDLTVKDIMTSKVKVCALTARVKDIAKTMTSEEIHHVVVMDNGKVHGMISSLDIIKALI